MKITDFCKVMRIELVVRYVPRAVGPWISGFERPYGRVFFKDSECDIMERGCSGWGSSPAASLQNFIDNLRTDSDVKFVVLVDGQGNRQIFGIPELDSV